MKSNEKLRLSIIILASTFVAACSNGGDNSNAPQKNTPPRVSVSAQNGTELQELSITATAIDAEGQALSFQWRQTNGIELQLSEVNTGILRFVLPPVTKNETVKLQVRVTDSQGASATADTEVTIISKPCTVTAVPADLAYPAFYEKYCSVFGIPVVSSKNVPDAALQVVTDQAEIMLFQQTATIRALINNKVRLAIMSKDEVTTDIPEHADLNVVFPYIDWNTRARGLGATLERPASSSAEENILCYDNDPYRGENIFIHEFAHSTHLLGTAYTDSNFQNRLNSAYSDALNAGLWANTYAASNEAEYWAEGVQSWFNANLEADPADGVHNAINTRAELESYDPTLYALIKEYYPMREIHCPDN